MTDDRLDEVIREAARGYHEPPATPREELWARIQTARARHPAVTPISAGRRWVGVSLAAAAVLALGIAIGRISRTTGPAAAPLIAAESAPAVGDAAYRVAATQYLGRAEALITLFIVDARQGGTARQARATARDLLTTNRLLQDSPAANDPRLKFLLDDLELVLAQIAQLSAERGRDEVDLIIQGLQQSGVMMRLRTAIPAGPGMRLPLGEL